jgi:D-tyrosyl-tRNA(Tyr) deacylase
VRALFQRVSEASVEVAGEKIAAIGEGLLIFLGVGRGDSRTEADRLADKTAGLRLFPDEAGKMNRSLAETGGQALVVSQFTLYGDCAKGRRPGFDQAAPPAMAEELYEYFQSCLVARGLKVAAGRFGASMRVSLVNDGPATFFLEIP